MEINNNIYFNSRLYEEDYCKIIYKYNRLNKSNINLKIDGIKINHFENDIESYNVERLDGLLAIVKQTKINIRTNGSQISFTQNGQTKVLKFKFGQNNVIKTFSKKCFSSKTNDGKTIYVWEYNDNEKNEFKLRHFLDRISTNYDKISVNINEVLNEKDENIIKELRSCCEGKGVPRKRVTTLKDCFTSKNQLPITTSAFTYFSSKMIDELKLNLVSSPIPSSLITQPPPPSEPQVYSTNSRSLFPITYNIDDDIYKNITNSFTANNIADLKLLTSHISSLPNSHIAETNFNSESAVAANENSSHSTDYTSYDTPCNISPKSNKIDIHSILNNPLPDDSVNNSNSSDTSLNNSPFGSSSSLDIELNDLNLSPSSINDNIILPPPIYNNNNSCQSSLNTSPLLISIENDNDNIDQVSISSPNCNNINNNNIKTSSTSSNSTVKIKKTTTNLSNIGPALLYNKTTKNVELINF